MNKNLEARMKLSTDKVEDKLKKMLSEISSDEIFELIKPLYDSMEYSLLSGGKRLRPFLVTEFCRICGGEPENALSYAAAVEMIHTYSLIHDDLPSMDDDGMRRGKLSNHMVFGEATALLSGDSLLTHAFFELLSNSLSAEQNMLAVKVLSKAAGPLGMAGGQQIDLSSEGKKISGQALFMLHKNKTGALIRASALLGCIAAGKYDDFKIRQAAESYANAIGLAFQITDDILDVIGDEKKLGKKCGSDEKSHKTTYVSLYGIDEAKAKALEQICIAKEALVSLGSSDISALEALCDYIMEREY